MLYKHKAVAETRAGGSSAYNMPTSPDGKTPLGVPITAILLGFAQENIAVEGLQR